MNKLKVGDRFTLTQERIESLNEPKGMIYVVTSLWGVYDDKGCGGGPIFISSTGSEYPQYYKDCPKLPRKTIIITL